MITQQRGFLCRIVIVALASQCHCNGFVPSRSGPTILRDSAHASSSPRGFPLFVSSQLYYRDGDDDLSSHVVENPSVSRTPNSRVQTQRRSEEASAVSMPLINAIWFNQVTLFLLANVVAIIASCFGPTPFDLSSLHWNIGGGGDSTAFHSLFDWQPTWFRIAEGILATIPMVTLGCMVEKSDDRDASRVNFSTTNMVVSLFGRRKSDLEPTGSASLQVMLLSAGIAVATGISEELIFRGLIPTAILSLTHFLPLALIGQAVFFSIGHISPKVRSGENRVVGSLQFVNGLWYGLVYLMAGGDILPCIVAHILYDMHILCETWTFINNQMDYTQKASQGTLDWKEQKEIQELEEGEGAVLNMDTVSFARRFFYAFDYDHVGSLSVSDCQRAISYAFMNDKVVPNSDTVADLFRQIQQIRSQHSIEAAIDSGGSATATTSRKQLSDRLRFAEFLHMLLILRSSASGRTS
jgi:membrane protease YdiL (CAAX protease family)